jgi:hypothetical protein
MSECIEVSTARTSAGYGVTKVTISRGCAYSVYAHRVAFEQTWGITLRPGQVVRHTCDNPPCINPLHLIVGTVGDNNRDIVERGRHWQQQKTHCPQGHPLLGDNLVASAKGRECRTCHNARTLSYMKRKYYEQKGSESVV